MYDGKIRHVEIVALCVDVVHRKRFSSQIIRNIIKLIVSVTWKISWKCSNTLQIMKNTQPVQRLASKYYNLESMTSLEENLSHFFLSLSAALNLFLDTFVAWTLSLQKGKFSILENSDDEMIFMDMLSYRSNEYFTQSYTFFLKYTDGHAINVSNLTYELYIYIYTHTFPFYLKNFIPLKKQFQFLKIH